MKLTNKIISGYSIICIIWGSTWGIVKIGLDYFPPFLFASLRFIIAAVALSVILGKAVFQFPRNKTFWYIVFILSIFAFALPLTFIYFGQSFIPSALASVLFATFPFWVTIASMVFLKNEALTWYQYIGLILGFSGALMLFEVTSIDISNSHFLGMLAILLSAVMQSLPLIVVRKHGFHFDSIHFNFYAMFIAGLILFPFSIMFDNYEYIDIRFSGVISVLFLGVFGTAATFVIYFWLTKHISPFVLSLSAFITPLIAIFIGVAFLEEIWNRSMTIGSSAILLGVLLGITNKSILKEHIIPKFSLYVRTLFKKRR